MPGTQRGLGNRDEDEVEPHASTLGSGIGSLGEVPSSDPTGAGRHR